MEIKVILNALSFQNWEIKFLDHQFILLVNVQVHPTVACLVQKNGLNYLQLRFVFVHCACFRFHFTSTTVDSETFQARGGVELQLDSHAFI